ncbi:MAG: hypothetical protein IPK79_13410 [Vampirovibrionales bacterium]|nr:hypothetical protein [Vampirovibrionales bacterium]
MSEIDLRTRRFLDLSVKHYEQKRILQELAIKRENSRRLRRSLLRNGAIFIAAAVSIFAAIWWFGL